MRELTPRKIHILRLWAEGCTDDEIARKLRISYSTVRNHAYSLFSFLDLQEAFRLLAIARAVELGHLNWYDKGTVSATMDDFEAAMREIEAVIRENDAA